MGVSKNNGTPKSSILIGFSIINHPFWGTPMFGNTYMLYRTALQTDDMEFLGQVVVLGVQNCPNPKKLHSFWSRYTPKINMEPGNDGFQ